MRRLVSLAAPLGALLFSICLFGQDPVATSLRGQINLNGSWQTNASSAPSPIPITGWTSNRVPALPVTDGTVAMWYQTSFYLPSAWQAPGRRWFLRFAQVGHYAAVYVNGQLAGQNWGQFAPFEYEITSYVLTGKNAVSVYVHNSDSTYAYQGANLNQSGCESSGLPSNCEALAYRSAANDPVSRNWIGITGDVALLWRPSSYIQSVVIAPSVRNNSLSAEVMVAGSGSYTVTSSVIGGPSMVPATVQAGIPTMLPSASWTNYIRWGPPGYGSPALYVLKTQLYQGGALIDTEHEQFGFREVWTSGNQLLLNGTPLQMVGNYNSKLSNIRMTNDRRPLAALLSIYQSSGLNAYVEHWDQNPILPQLASEMGLLTEGSFYCDGALPQSQADSSSAWKTFMAAQTQAWLVANINQPSIVMWRPFDVMPTGVQGPVVVPELDGIISEADLQARPIVDGGTFPTSIDYSSIDGEPSPGKCGNLSSLESQLSSQTRPLLVKEIYAGQELSCAPGMFTAIDQLMNTYPAMTGMVIQYMDFNTQVNFTPSWESQSGLGNRPASQKPFGNGMLPDWLGSWIPTSWSSLFASLDPQQLTVTAPQWGDYETAAPPGAVLGFLTGREPHGVTVDGNSAWFAVFWTGNDTLTWYDNAGNVLSSQSVTITEPNPY